MICGTVSQSRKAAREHYYLVHKKGKSHACGQCGKHFKQESQLARHLTLSHNDDRPFKCPHCDHTAKKAGHLEAHVLLKHTDERPFACDYPHCGRAFKLKHHLDGHMRIHSDKMTISCPECPRSYKSASGLRRHLKVDHKHGDPLKCPHCDTVFYEQRQLDSHIWTHSDVKQFPCPECHRSFAKKASLETHLQSAHSEPPPDQSPPEPKHMQWPSHQNLTAVRERASEYVRAGHSRQCAAMDCDCKGVLPDRESTLEKWINGTIVLLCQLHVAMLNSFGEVETSEGQFIRKALPYHTPCQVQLCKGVVATHAVEKVDGMFACSFHRRLHSSAEKVCEEGSTLFMICIIANLCTARTTHTHRMAVQTRNTSCEQ